MYRLVGENGQVSNFVCMFTRFDLDTRQVFA